VMPVDVTLDLTGTTAYTCNFLAGSISALTVDLESGTLSSPRVCSAPDPRTVPGIPEKVKKLGPSKAAQALGFPEGFPEDGPHPHGTACDPSGKWLVMGCLGTNHLYVFSLPVGEAFSNGTAHFVLDGTHPDERNRHDGGGPRQLVFAPDGQTLYSVQELDHTLAAYSFDGAAGKLALVGEVHQTIPQAWLDTNPPCPYLLHSLLSYAHFDFFRRRIAAIWMLTSTLHAMLNGPGTCTTRRQTITQASPSRRTGATCTQLLAATTRLLASPSVPTVSCRQLAKEVWRAAVARHGP
jgi:hypothetical protein